MSSNLPSGIVTFLFTDIEGSTPLWERDPEGMGESLARHHAVLRSAIEAHGGQVFKTVGDAFQAAFAAPSQAVHAAVAGQRGLAAAHWGRTGPLKVRMGIHIGPVRAEGAEYAVAHTLNRVARIMSSGYGGQILLSVEVADLVRGDLPSELILRDLGRHRMKGMTQLEHLFQVVTPDLPADFPPLKSSELTPNNLPVQLTSFVGREKEISEIKQVIREQRLLTLTGSGGTGKTRLSLQVAGDLLDQFPGGVWLVELAPLADPALVMQGVASTFALKQDAGRSLETALKDYLREKNLLLILDNCEHLIAACAQFADTFLHACPKLTILASSREVLGVAGETAYRVPSLSIPDPDHLPPIGTLSEFDAVRLFVDRAVMVQPSFVVTPRNAPAVAQICFRLDGIPLALELAASRLKALKVEDLEKRLDNRFRLLTGGSRTALPRQQTLRALIDWSYELLSEPERALLRRVSVFADGWTLEAVEFVCADENPVLAPPALIGEAAGGISRGDILDLITHLVDKSLIILDEQAEGTRYRILETIRQYAQEKLYGSGERDQLWNRHLEYFCQLAEQAEPGLEDIADQSDWGDRLELEHDNLRSAMDRSKSLEGGLELGLRLAGALMLVFWEARSYLQEGRTYLAALLARSTDWQQSPARAKALAAAAQLTFRQGDYVEARELGESSLKLYRGIGDKRWIAIVLCILANIGTELGDYETTPAMFKEALALSTEVNDKRWAVLSLFNLGYAELRPGDLQAAAAHFAQALALSREMGDKFMIGFELAALGEVAVRQGDYPRATNLLEESLESRRQMDHKWGVGVSLGTLGWVAMRQEDWSKAKTRLGESLEVRQEIGDKGGSAWCLERLAEVAEAHGQLAQTVRIFGAAAALRESIASVMDPVDQPEYERRLNALHAALGEEQFLAAWAAGRALRMEQAIAYALGSDSTQWG